METVDLYKENQCCGCGACIIKCPKHAIILRENEYGFTYPVIDSSRCIDCKTCINVCAYGVNNIKKQAINYNSYACVTSDEELLMNSASGGVFSAISYEFIKNGGYVAGATSSFQNGKISVKHIVINHIEDLYRLQGSKYVQSDTIDSFIEIGNLLKNGEKVLFSGTPCQVDAVKSLYEKYLGRQLYTIDIICHGVPSQRLLNGYLEEYQNSRKAELKYIDFRNKKYGWGLTGIAVFNNGHTETFTPTASSYYRYFLDGEIYRDNCYSCPYANLNRVGDISIGDYWGASRYSPELFQNGLLSEKKGISCLIVNNDIGESLIQKYGLKLTRFPVEIRKILIINTQLKEPARHTQKRERILESFKRHNGYRNIEIEYRREMLIRRAKQRIKLLIPEEIKQGLKKWKNN